MVGNIKFALPGKGRNCRQGGCQGKMQPQCSLQHCPNGNFSKEPHGNSGSHTLGSLVLGSRSIFVSTSCGKRASKPNDRGKHDHCLNPYLLPMDAQGLSK